MTGTGAGESLRCQGPGRLGAGLGHVTSRAQQKLTKNKQNDRTEKKCTNHQPHHLFEMKENLRLTWSDTEISYNYCMDQITVEKCAVRGNEKPADPFKQANTPEFLCEIDAIISSRNKAMRENLEGLERMHGHLEFLQSGDTSLQDLQSIESQIMEALDNSRQFDYVTGDMYESDEYKVLESRLSLMSDAIHCLSQKLYIEGLPYPTHVEIRSFNETEQRKPAENSSYISQSTTVPLKKKSRIHCFYAFKCIAPKMIDES